MKYTKLFPLILFIGYCLSTEILFDTSVLAQSTTTAQTNTDSSADGYRKLANYLDELDSYSANFQQQIISSTRRLQDTTSGEFFMKRPNRFRWQIMTPYEQTIIADGENIWSIDNDLEQVTVTGISSSITNSPIMLITQKNQDIESLYRVDTLTSESGMELFVLKPKDQSSNFEFIQLGFDESILKTIELHDSLGQVTYIHMTNIRRNPIIANKLFVYNEIEGFDLIDSRTRDPQLD